MRSLVAVWVIQIPFTGISVLWWVVALGLLAVFVAVLLVALAIMVAVGR